MLTLAETLAQRHKWREAEEAFVRAAKHEPGKLVRARRCRLALSKVASDHLPIVADFRLARR
jgi:hypothetical protein